MADQEKNRYKARESFYKSMLYGFEELKNRYQKTGNYSRATEMEKRILIKDESAAYNYCLTLALNIEANIWANIQKNKKGETYASRVRTLLRYLCDDSNFELRLKVLIGLKKPDDLFHADAAQLAPSSVNKMKQEREEQLKKESEIKDDFRIITKTHKGEIIIETPEVVDKDERLIKQVDDNIDTETEVKVVENIKSENISSVKPIKNGNYQKVETNIVNKDDQHSLLSESKDEKFKNDKGLYSVKKLTQKPKLEDICSTSNDNSRKNGIGKLNSKSTYEDNITLSYNIANKYIDQELLKSLKDNTTEKIYTLLSERLKNNLRNSTGQYLLDQLNKTYSKLCDQQQQFVNAHKYV